MNRLYADSRDYLAQARREGANIDEAMMIDMIKRLEGEAEQNLRGFMNDDEYTRWGQYRQKSMWRDSRSLWRYVK